MQDKREVENHTDSQKKSTYIHETNGSRTSRQKVSKDLLPEELSFKVGGENVQ